MNAQNDQQGKTNLIWPNLALLKNHTDEQVEDIFDEIDSIRKAAIEDQDATGGDVSTTGLFLMLKLNTEILTETYQALGGILLLLRATFGDTDKEIVFKAGTVGPQPAEDKKPETKETTK